MLDYHLVINSHVNYWDNAGKKCYNSIVENFPEYPRENIHIFCSGGDIEKGYINSNYENSPLTVCPYNSFEYSCLIAILELNLEYKHFFLLHDTTFAGPKFKEKIGDFNRNLHAVPLCHFPSMNMGMYRLDHVRENQQYIMNLRNTKYDTNDLKLFKGLAINHEDRLLHQKKITETYDSHPVLHPTKTEYYSFLLNPEKPRKVEYFPNLDLVKVKANFSVTGPYHIDL